MQTLREHSTWE